MRWEVFARSLEGRPIEFAQFGQGGKQVLVIGSLEGDEPEGVAAAEALAANLARFPRRIDGVQITIVADPNPDGRARRIRGNARGVDLARNFPAANWRRTIQGNQLLSGPKPSSEPETQAIVELCEDLKPDRIVLLGSAKAPAGVLYAGPAENLARQVTIEADGRLLPRSADELHGSLLMLAGEDWKVPVLRLSFPPAATADEVFSRHKTAIMTAVGCGTPIPFADVARKPASQSIGQSANASLPSNGSSPYLGGYGVAPIAAPSANLADVASQPAPATLDYSSIQAGRPTVRIESPRRLRRAQTTEIATVPPSFVPATSAPAWPARLERLPTVNVPQQMLPGRNPPAFPQAPIPAYPQTQPQ
ncbi:MAG TPA: M14 family zinc carboxypeptidase [Pirellulales bacterium]|nr:M14 family zinc carboxypeptidase [Pirellulales bacterium]